jgi:agmatinase
MDFAIVGVPFDKTQTLRKGAARSPDILRKVFPKLETYIYGVDLVDAAFLKDFGNVEADDIYTIEKEVTALVQTGIRDAFPIFLGGDHSISAVCATALKPEKVVIFDAHADCEDSDGHDGVARRLIQQFGKENVFLYGVRVASKVEDRYIRENKIKLVDLNGLRKLKGRIYLSIDLDVLDPSIIGSVGNPEPMGKMFHEVAEAITVLADKLVAMDVVEFTPLKTDEMGVHALIAGKLIYGAMASMIKAKG